MAGEAGEDKPRSEEIVKVEDLTLGYGETIILEKVNFSVREREILAILGPSGCGKTTLLRALIGLLPPKSGSIRILDETIGGAGDEEAVARMRRYFGVLFQEGALLGSLTLADNVALPLEEFTDLPPELIAEIVQLKLDLVELGDSARQRPAELSGGMLKRAGLARAMALDPQILFCDEPTAGLDPPTAIEVDRLLLELRRLLGITIVIISHELASIENIADRCLMLDREARGIIAAGTPRELEESDDPRVHTFFERNLSEKPENPENARQEQPAKENSP